MPLKPHPLPQPWNRRDPLLSESTIQKQVIAFLELRGCFVQRIEGGGKAVQRRGELAFAKSCMTGFPDLLVVHRGTVFALEIKAPGGHLSQAQVQKMVALRDHGARVAVVVGVDQLWDWMQGRCSQRLRSVESILCVDLNSSHRPRKCTNLSVAFRTSLAAS
jgi:hypothetical protein